MVPPVGLVTSGIIITPYSVDISWVTPYVTLDMETYTVWYSTDMSLQNSSKVVIDNTNEFAINHHWTKSIHYLLLYYTS